MERTPPAAAFAATFRAITGRASTAVSGLECLHLVYPMPPRRRGPVPARDPALRRYNPIHFPVQRGEFSLATRRPVYCTRDRRPVASSADSSVLHSLSRSPYVRSTWRFRIRRGRLRSFQRPPAVPILRRPLAEAMPAGSPSRHSKRGDCVSGRRCCSLSSVIPPRQRAVNHFAAPSLSLTCEARLLNQ